MALNRLTFYLVFFAAVYIIIMVVLIVYARIHHELKWQPVAFQGKPETSLLPFKLITNYWTATNVNTSFFAAYFDDRKHALPLLLLMGAHKGLYRPLFCQPFYEDGERDCLPITLRFYSGDRNRGPTNFHPYRYVCQLNRTSVPNFVRVFDDPECVLFWGNQTLIPVAAERPNVRKPFGLCIGSPVFRGKGLGEIVHAIEGNRILGSQWFTIYVQEVGEKTIQGLKVYEKRGHGEVIDTWTSEGKPSNWFYNGQLLAINDCLYRNMFRFKYLVITDLDELIVPEQSLSWHKMMAEIDERRYGAFLFRHRTYVPPKKFKISTLIRGNGSEMACSDGSVLAVPRCIEYYRKGTLILRDKVRSKHIVKPRLVNAIAIHNIKEFHDRKLTYLSVPVHIGLLRHYRRRAAYKSDAPHIDDPRLKPVAKRLMRNIHDMLCNTLREFW